VVVEAEVLLVVEILMRLRVQQILVVVAAQEAQVKASRMQVVLMAVQAS
jgi:hypothetical protein